MAEGFHSSADEAVLKDVLALAKKQKVGDFEPGGEPTRAFASYVSQLVRFATGEDRIWDEPQALLDRIASAWEASAVRKPGTQLIKLRLNKAADWRQTRLVLDLVTEDKPFLVDSVSAALADAGKPVSFFVNAVIGCDRDEKGRRTTAAGVETMRESMIHAELDPPVDDEEIPRLEAELQRVLDDIAQAVADFEPMRLRLGQCIAQLERARPQGVAHEDQREAVEFLKWLWDNRFTFLGVRHYRYAKANGKVEFEHSPESDLGILRDNSRRVLKSTYSEAGHLSPAVEEFMNSGEPILVAKANAKSLVHRRVYMDYLGIKTYAPDGKVNGEDRFVGLFTSDAYNRPASDIPLLRAKVRKVVETAGFMPGGHNEKAIINILETFPRDEMFQDDVETLGETALGILRLYKRPRVKLFMRRDRFDRFISAFVFIPRERFSSEVREQIGALLARTFHGRMSAFYPYFDSGPLARVHFIIGLDPGAPAGPGIPELTRQIRALCRDWSDELLDTLRAAHEGVTPRGLYAKYVKAFDAAYREDMPASEALLDIAELEKQGNREFTLRVFRKANGGPSSVNIKIYRRGGAMRLSSLIPTLENLGLSVIYEEGYHVKPLDDPNNYWVHDFHTEEKLGREIDIAAIKKTLEDAMTAVMEGRCEDDGFNALVVDAELNWREAWMLRASAKYHLQAGFAFSQKYIEEALAKHAKIARELIAVFHARFNPAGPRNPDQREEEVKKAESAVLTSLEAVQSLDEDRIMRRYLNLFSSILRTNYYQRTADGGFKPYISFKIDSSRIDTLPDPRPYREIFVSGPRVDGVHLRFGPVARGGLRWSDRREDFRTEVLGLVKAQRVKNAVIVPTGSKGGFYPKQLPLGDRNAIYEEGREAYKLFVRGLLDLTDNIVGGEVKPPANMVLWDNPDPYLVVAADKGTAAFSDTANAISAEYGFWLGDAFASGGSAGYDHKVMGITARGGWEAVKRHFREMGKDIQTEPFTVAGIGDMSGDVFGNGMLLSEQIKLVAAFDHRDIFIDPTPDAAKSFAERKRMFDLPRSSWQDYDKKLISKGGGVFPRSAKSIPLTPEIKKLLDIKADKATPSELMRAILLAQVELFWLGGIGTYFKASYEDNAKVGDRANDMIRIDGNQIRAKVIGEGANLGLTQAARVEFARNGGRLNTDAIDNSAGVDSSDHEVNIKILVSSAIEHGDLKSAERNDLLKSMTEDVAAHVLRHNYEQTRAISQMEAMAPGELDGHARLIAAFEHEGRLDRALEGLPDAETFNALRGRGLGLTRPELAVLLAYSKMWFFEELVESTAPDDPLLERELFGYFPEALHKFTDAIVRHRLRREIIATRLSNEIVDTCGASFPYRAVEATGARPAQVALAYEAARRIWNLGDFAAAVDALDNAAPAALQTALYNTASDLLREQLYRIVSDPHAMALLERRGLKGVIEQYEEPVTTFKESLTAILPPEAVKALKARAAKWKKEGAPEKLAQEAAHMPALERAFDVVSLARETNWSTRGAGAVFFAIGRWFDIDTARDQARTSPPSDHFDRLASRRLAEDLSARQAALSQSVIAFAGKEPKGAPSEWLDDLMARWRDSGAGAITDYERFVSDIELASGISVGKLSLLSKKLADIAERLKAA